MLFGETVRVALQSIRANLFRAVLTMLGIIIGVGAVITKLAAGAGAQREIDEQIAALGSNLLTLTTSQFFSRGVARDQQTLRIEDIAALREDARYIDAVVPETQNRVQLKLEDRNTNVRLIGTTHQYVEMFGLKLAGGRFFTAQEDSAKRRVVVLGAEIAPRLAAQASDVVGKTVAVDGQPFEVVGVLETVGGSFGPNADSSVFVPWLTSEQRVLGRRRLENIHVRVIGGVPLEQAMVDLERVLRREHKILPGGRNDFSIVDRQQFLATQQAAQETFGLLLASIAGVSLLVGGIGIMNIMLVSVTERTREIGVRMALGATRLNILLQFLVESVTLCLLGGLLGIGAGYGAAKALSTYAGWQTFVAPESVGLAFLFSVTVGLFFGLWPARRAARLDPIEALRYE
jgi:putative ABC transport system permease protein